MEFVGGRALGMDIYVCVESNYATKLITTNLPIHTCFIYFSYCQHTGCYGCDDVTPKSFMNIIYAIPTGRTWWSASIYRLLLTNCPCGIHLPAGVINSLFLYTVYHNVLSYRIDWPVCFNKKSYSKTVFLLGIVLF